MTLLRQSSVCNSIAIGLSQHYIIARHTVAMLDWLCCEESVPLSVQNSNLAMLRQMNGLDRLADLLRPAFLSSDQELISKGSFLLS